MIRIMTHIKLLAVSAEQDWLTDCETSTKSREIFEGSEVFEGNESVAEERQENKPPTVESFKKKQSKTKKIFQMIR